MAQSSLNLPKITAIKGSVTLPGSKSLTNRALLCAALSRGSTRLMNALDSDDTRRMLEALALLGVKISRQGGALLVSGLGGPFDGGLDKKVLDLGNAGTAMRPLCAALCFSRGVFELTGEPRMCERPIGPLVQALKSAGGKIGYTNNAGFPPVVIRGSTPHSHEVTVDGSLSSQFLSALLLAAPLAGGLKVKVTGDLISKPYVDLTCALLKKFGATIKRRGYSEFEVSGGIYEAPGTYLIEGDASAATYFAAAAAVAGEVVIRGLGEDSVQGDYRFLEVLERMGARVERGEDYVKVSKAPQLSGIDIDMNAMPDAAMTLVPLCLYTKGPVTIRNIASWRVKETDRLDAMATEMRKLGVLVDCGNDYISLNAAIRNQETPRFATYNDHRMAMCLSLCALERDIVIENPECVSKTFPRYFEEFAAVAVTA
ncbi:MAG: 3-phosphoshikimate 1-carboxyvinyltransferase [Succinivibrio sp.]|nr:3-phosphoshikimate 1-carboxyvinyltransferase [Succinivibrio sp.]